MKIKPIYVVVITVLICSLGLTALGWWIRHYQRKIEVAVSYDESPAKSVGASKPALQKPDAMNPDGEMFHTAKRVREAGALLVQASLFNATSRIQGRVPATVADVAVGIILPPGIALRGAGIYESVEAVYYLRYRVQPMAFEVVAQPKTNGPKMFLRLDPKALDSDGLKYYEATRLGEVEIPSPFASPATFLGKGWSDQRLQTDPFKTEEKSKLINWAKIAEKE